MSVLHVRPERMHYEHLDHLYPFFQSLVVAYRIECPIDFENPGEAIVTCFVDSICSEDLQRSLRSKAIASLSELKKDQPEKVDEFITTTIGYINLIGGCAENKTKIHDALPLDLQGLWTKLDHQKPEA